MKQNRRWIGAISASVMVLTVAGCGDSGGSTGGGGAIEKDSPAFVAAGDRVEAFSAPQDYGLPVTDPVAVPDDGLTIAFTQCSASVCTEIGDAVADAAEALGATYKPFFHQDTPETVQTAFQNAIAADADIVLTSGNPVEWFQKEMDELNESGSVVVGWSIPGGYQVDGIAANLLSGDDYYLHGVLMADYAATKAEGSPNVLLLNAPSFPVLQILGDGFTNELKEVCPDCKVTSVDVTIDDIVNGNVPAAAVAAIQREPDVNFIVGGFGGLITNQLSQALNSAGFDGIPMISAAGTQANYDLIASGDQEADLAIPSGFLAWRAVDAGLRALAGQDVGTFVPETPLEFPEHPEPLAGGVPQLFVDKDTVPAKSPFQSLPDYQAEFEKLWGLAP